MERPEEHGPHERLQDLNRDLFFLEARVDFAASLAGSDDFRDQPAALLHVLGDYVADTGAGQE